MAADLYDLMWLFPLPPSERPANVQLSRDNTLAPPSGGLAAAILYPALLTPAIVVGRDWLELLIAFDKKGLDGLKVKGEELAKAVKLAVNTQLKIHRGSLNVGKFHHNRPLLGGEDWADHIKVEGPLKLDTAPMETAGWKDAQTSRKDSAFVGRLQPSFVDLLKKNKVVFDQIYKVSINSVPVFDAFGPPGQVAPRNKPRDEGGWEIAPAVPGNFDHVIHAAPGIQSEKLPGKGRYAFELAGDDVVAGSVDWNNPIQAYHPVFAYSKLEYADIGFLADVHVNCRQQVLKRSPASVIEHDDFKPRPIGKILNIASRDTKNLLNHLGDSDAEVIVIGGDLFDFMHNVVLDDHERAQKQKVMQIWDFVDMKKRTRYRDYVDCAAFYGLVTKFIADYHKPLLVLTGNHDCYYEPYGISPRVTVAGKELRRANEGIPWDHNLTMYEAILAFGPTYGAILTGLNVKSRPPSSFWAEKLAWFYTAFTPFSDFVVRLPHQYLAVLGWGTSEDMLSPSRPSGQGFGHLPRANTVLSDEQLKVLESGATSRDDGRKVVMFTHFNFVSYDGSISNAVAADSKWGSSNDQSDVYYTAKWYSTRDFSKSDMGTFHEKREKLYKEILFQKQRVQLILTGHSHRRGFYTLRRLDTTGNASVKTGFHDYPVFDNGKPMQYFDHKGVGHRIPDEDQKPPYIIVSDSGGSIPRMNLAGEFGGWGSDLPAGTRVMFDSRGDIAQVKAVRAQLARAQPRFVVALDYMDIMEKQVIKSFATDKFPVAGEDAGAIRYFFTLEFIAELLDRNVYDFSVDSVALYFSATYAFGKIELEKSASDPREWVIPEDDEEDFRFRAITARKRRTFLALRFSSQSRLFERYDFSTPWTYEVVIKQEVSGLPGNRHKKIIFERKKEYAEFPDLMDRRGYPNY